MRAPACATARGERCAAGSWTPGAAPAGCTLQRARVGGGCVDRVSSVRTNLCAHAESGAGQQAGRGGVPARDGQRCASGLYGAGERCVSGLYGAGERCVSGLYGGAGACPQGQPEAPSGGSAPASASAARAAPAPRGVCKAAVDQRVKRLQTIGLGRGTAQRGRAGRETNVGGAGGRPRVRRGSRRGGSTWQGGALVHSRACRTQPRACRTHSRTWAGVCRGGTEEGEGGCALQVSISTAGLRGMRPSARSPHPPPRTKWTRRVPHPVLIGHAASLTP